MNPTVGSTPSCFEPPPIDHSILGASKSYIPIIKMTNDNFIYVPPLLIGVINLTFNFLNLLYP